MNLRLEVFALSAKYKLSDGATAKLKQLAELGTEPPTLSKQLPMGMAILGATLGGLGIIFWIAANWASLPRFTRFSLLEFMVAAMFLGAWFRPSIRVPLGLLGFLACGGLFAYFGQTYQTGADPWQLFALWALLTLPLCLSVRHDVLWTGWAVITLTAILLWTHTYPSFARTSNESLLMASTGTWVPAFMLAFAFSAVLKPVTGAGTWPMRLCMVYATVGLSMVSIKSLSTHDGLWFYTFFLIIFGVLGYAFSLPRLFDIFVISALGLGLNVIVAGGLVKMLPDRLPDRHIGDLTGALLMVACIAASLLAGTVKFITQLARKHGSIQRHEQSTIEAPDPVRN